MLIQEHEIGLELLDEEKHNGEVERLELFVVGKGVEQALFI